MSNGCYIVSMMPVILVVYFFMNRERLSVRGTSHLTGMEDEVARSGSAQLDR